MPTSTTHLHLYFSLSQLPLAMATSMTISALIPLLLIILTLVPIGTTQMLMPMPMTPEFVSMCKMNMGFECGNRVNIYIFGRGTLFPDRYCSELVGVGKQCHDAIIKKHLVGKPSGFATKVLKKSDWLWDHCGRVVEYQKRSKLH